jgi:CcmD family protein
MNPGPTLGSIAVAAAYAIVLLALLVFISLIAKRQKKLERRRSELKGRTADDTDDLSIHPRNPR